MNKAFSTVIVAIACAGSVPALAQFSPTDLKRLEERIGPSKDSVPQLLPQIPPPPMDLKSTSGICDAAKQSLPSGTPLPLSLTSISSMLDSAGKHLLRDGKDQFETTAQYEARQVSRRNVWIAQNQFFVLPADISTSANVYNADTQIYTLDAAGTDVTLTPKGRYLSSGFEKILFQGKIQSLQGQMDQYKARRFFENRASYMLIYIAEPIVPFVQKSGYSFNETYALTASAACRFVWDINDQRVLYFSRP